MVPAGGRQPPHGITPIPLPHTGGLAIYDHPSRYHMPSLPATLVPLIHYPHDTPYRVHCLYFQTIYL